MKSPEWWMAVLTALLCVVTYLQWRAARDSIDDARTALVLTNRAYIGVHDALLFHTTRVSETEARIADHGKAPLKPGDVPALQVMFKNTGNTPARNMKTFGMVMVGPFPADNVEITANIPFIQSVTVLSKDEEYGIHMPFHALSDTEITSIDSRTQFLEFWGFATYDDMFGFSRRTDFCYYWDAAVNNEMIPCPSHNRVQ